MIESTEDLWEIKVDWLCITTNGIVSRRNIMGGGCALEAKKKFPRIDKVLGAMIKEGGNHVHLLIDKGEYTKCIFSFPTKNDWRDPSDLKLIEQSCREFKKRWQNVVDASQGTFTPRCAIPQAGTGLGGLNWKDVKPFFEKYFSEDSFIIVSK